MERAAPPSSNVPQKQTANVGGRLKQPRPQGQVGPHEIATVVPGFPQALTLGSAYNKDCRDLQHLGFNPAVIMHSFKRERMQISIIDPDDAVSLK